MLIGASDPGAESPGFAVWDTDLGRHVYVSATSSNFPVCDVTVVESGFIGRMGLKAMWGLGFCACHCLYAMPCTGDRYTIRPDGAASWRAALPVRPGLHAKFDGLPKDVAVARLRIRYGVRAGAEATDDMIEAMGIAEAAAAILARPKAKDRKALKRVAF